MQTFDPRKGQIFPQDNVELIKRTHKQIKEEFFIVNGVTETSLKTLVKEPIVDSQLFEKTPCLERLLLKVKVFQLVSFTFSGTQDLSHDATFLYIVERHRSSTHDYSMEWRDIRNHQRKVLPLLLSTVQTGVLVPFIPYPITTSLTFYVGICESLKFSIKITVQVLLLVTYILQ